MPIECLLIDDDLDDQEIFLMALRQVSSEINCIAMQDCIGALKELKEGGGLSAEYIFLDINMPKMSGLQCLEKIRSQSHLQQVKVYMFSTTSDPGMISKTMQAGANGFVVKPTSIRSLVESLTIILEREQKV